MTPPIANRKRPPAVDLPSPPEKRRRETIEKFQNRIIDISGGTVNNEPWQSALERGTISILPLSAAPSCKKGVSNSYYITSNNELISPAILKPAFFGSPDTVLWCPSEKIASIVSKTLNLNLVPNTEIGMISSEYIPTALFPEGCSAVCSIQDFKPATKNVSACSLDKQRAILESPSRKISSQIRKIAMLDIILLNGDRGSQNLLVNEKGKPKKLTPIDHSLILDSKKSLKAYWLHAEACKEQFNKKEKTFIQKLQFSTLQNAILEELPGTPDATLKTLETNVQFLKAGAHLALTPYELGSLMCKDSMQEKSFVEHCQNKAKDEAGDFSTNIKSILKSELETISPRIKSSREAFPPLTFPLPRDPRSSTLIQITDELSNSYK